MRWLLLCALCMGCSETIPGSDEAGVVINEIMVRNRAATGIVAPDGSSADWVELYNMGSDTARLADYFLSDDCAQPMKANLPNVTLAPGAYLTLWCGGDANEGAPFLGFKLSADEESADALRLTHRARGLVDSCHYRSDDDALAKGRSYGRLPDGGTRWFKQRYPSPSNPNNG